MRWANKNIEAPLAFLSSHHRPLYSFSLLCALDGGAPSLGYTRGIHSLSSSLFPYLLQCSQWPNLSSTALRPLLAGRPSRPTNRTPSTNNLDQNKPAGSDSLPHQTRTRGAQHTTCECRLARSRDLGRVWVESEWNTWVGTVICRGANRVWQRLGSSAHCDDVFVKWVIRIAKVPEHSFGTISSIVWLLVLEIAWSLGTGSQATFNTQSSRVHSLHICSSRVGCHSGWKVRVTARACL